MSLFEDNRELQFETWGLKVSHVQVGKSKEHSFKCWGVEGAVVKEESVGGNRQFKV